MVLPIQVYKKKPLMFALCKPAYCFGENGTILCENNIGKIVSLDIETDKFVKLDINKAHLKDKMAIPFAIRLGALQTTQMALLKQQSLVSNITIHATYGNVIVTETLRLIVGEALTGRGVL
jgi:hypothetical protein